MNLRGLSDFVLGGYTFFFRWPVFRVQRFFPASIFLAPWLQAGWFAIFAFLLDSLGIFSPLTTGVLACFALSALSGFFHEDGLADTFDSLGVSKFNDSAENLDKIRFAMKDSRLGTFGVSGLVFLWLFRFLSFGEFSHSWQVWVFVVAMSRFVGLSVALAIGRWTKPGRDLRSAHLMKEANLTQVLLLAGMFFISLFFSMGMSSNPSVVGAPFVVSSLITAAVAWGWLAVVSKRSGGMCGDLIGSTVLISEFALSLFLYISKKLI